MRDQFVDIEILKYLNENFAECSEIIVDDQDDLEALLLLSDAIDEGSTDKLYEFSVKYPKLFQRIVEEEY